MKRFLIALLMMSAACAGADARVVKGKVLGGGKRLSGVVVTDGMNFTQTRRNGTFRFDICDSAGFVYVVTPSGYTADWSGGSPEFYRAAAGESDFVFDLKDTGNSSSYSIIAVGDPQPRKEKHFLEFADRPLDDIRSCAASLGRFTVGIVLGDVCFDVYPFQKRWKEEIVRTGIPFYPVVGNHDHNRNFSDDELAIATYRENFGPENYAFFIGDDVVIVLDNIIYHSRSGYELGYTDRQLEWVRGLMKYVPSGADVYVAQHSPLNGRHYSKMIVNHDVLLDILKGHEVTFMSGHNHTNANFEYAPGVTEHNVAAICGTWWDVYHCTDGTPRGYKVFTKENGSLSWYYKSIGKEPDFQYEVYRPGQTRLNPQCVVVNVWDYDSGWNLEWYEDGVRKGNMTRVEEYSPLHEADLKAVYEKVGRKPSDYRLTRKSDHYFAAQPSPEAETVEIVITDRFGRQWRERVEL